MNRRRFLSGICGVVAAILGWPKKAEDQVSTEVWIEPMPGETNFEYVLTKKSLSRLEEYKAERGRLIREYLSRP